MNEFPPAVHLSDMTFPAALAMSLGFGNNSPQITSKVLDHGGHLRVSLGGAQHDRSEVKVTDLTRKMELTFIYVLHLHYH